GRPGDGLDYPGKGDGCSGSPARRPETFRRLNIFLQDFLSGLLDAAGRGELNPGTVDEFILAGSGAIKGMIQHSGCG
ncbi:MAG TPA: hypothetical protein GXX25_10080, partial [Desulfotomaculum sp.]|nr:hypothetical protein [Desulfotomaculum sp.]